MAEVDKPNATIDELSVVRAEAGRALARLARRDIKAAEMVQLVARARQIGPEDILRRGRRAEIAAGRQLAMYLAHVMLGLSLTEVGALFGRDRTTVAYACAQIEDQRDDAAFDAEVSRLEAAIGSCESAPAAGELRHAG
jgi:chromosomal replication initiation ATPase DnaA